uniref:Uncharacterized protein n=1 Tax=Chromera velia CCMP2878 TaxID=1169474 RepID=A0A0G4HZJ7_9ALVE|eukprot:Cvel_9718.t1-p1 / transcript=Cvel_9718.t1 / gene=Cvel_9718 / organism=Chromera_velia_CCMP2878 / gene_product=Fibrillin-1, putative / transcript_product=Fibrillin-1, putative / location=Cvel_scaffold567:49018-73283(-) / protein_length=3313 / sequence_SO=supercontig / SO=protein_coding / is_pseudo=false
MYKNYTGVVCRGQYRVYASHDWLNNPGVVTSTSNPESLPSSLFDGSSEGSPWMSAEPISGTANASDSDVYIIIEFPCYKQALGFTWSGETGASMDQNPSALNVSGSNSTSGPWVTLHSISGISDWNVANVKTWRMDVQTGVFKFFKLNFRRVSSTGELPGAGNNVYFLSQSLDFDPCISGTHTCHADATCISSASSFSCSCNAGFAGDGIFCGLRVPPEDIGRGDSQSFTWSKDSRTLFDGVVTIFKDYKGGVCPGEYRVYSPNGWLGNPGQSDSVNETAEWLSSSAFDGSDMGSPWASLSANIAGLLGADESSEHIILGTPYLDECAAGVHNCDPQASCSNTNGSFTCTCNAGLDGDGVACGIQIPQSDIGRGDAEFSTWSKDDRTLFNGVVTLYKGYTGSVCPGTYRVFAPESWSNDPGFNTTFVPTEWVGSSLFDGSDLGKAFCTSETAGSEVVGQTNVSESAVPVIFGTPCFITPSGFAWQTRNDSNFDNVPSAMNVSGSNSTNGPWTSLHSFSDVTNWISEETKKWPMDLRVGSFSFFRFTIRKIQQEVAGVACGNQAFLYASAWTELDECAAGVHNCLPQANCTNTNGSFTCTCPPGLEGDGTNVCGIFLPPADIGRGDNEDFTWTKDDRNRYNGFVTIHKEYPGALCPGAYRVYSSSSWFGDTGNASVAYEALPSSLFDRQASGLPWRSAGSVAGFNDSADATDHLILGLPCFVSLNGYGWIACTDCCPDENPSALSVQGGNSTSGPWTTLHNFSGVTDWQNGDLKTWSVSTSAGPFSFFRFNVKRVNQATAGIASGAQAFLSAASWADLDECAAGLHNCDSLADCTNTNGSFTCTCGSGVGRDGVFCGDQIPPSDIGRGDSEDFTWTKDINNLFNGKVTIYKDYKGPVCPGEFRVYTPNTWSGDTGVNSSIVPTESLPSSLFDASSSGPGWCLPSGGVAGLDDPSESEVQIILGTPYHLTLAGYSWQAPADQNSAPSSLNMSGANSSSGPWTTVHSFTGVTDWAGMQERQWGVDLLTGPFNFFRFLVRRVQSPSSYSGCGLVANLYATSWRDIDECAVGLNDCNVLANCTNTNGSFACACVAGYGGNGTVCGDLNECLNSMLNDCDPAATCNNTEGSFVCTCGPGWTGNGTEGGCSELDECQTATHDCHVAALCTNVQGSFAYEYNTGFNDTGIQSGLPNGTDCTNVNECNLGTHDCAGSSVCNDSIGSFICICPEGFFEQSEICADDNECISGAHNCDVHASCSNTEGSFFCSCQNGFGGNGVFCIESLQVPCGTSSAFERTVVSGVPPDVCLFETNSLATFVKVNMPQPYLVGSQTLPNKTLRASTCNGVTLQDTGISVSNLANDTCRYNHSSGGVEHTAECTDTSGSFSCSCSPGFRDRSVKLYSAKIDPQLLLPGGSSSPTQHSLQRQEPRCNDGYLHVGSQTVSCMGVEGADPPLALWQEDAGTSGCAGPWVDVTPPSLECPDYTIQTDPSSSTAQLGSFHFVTITDPGGVASVVSNPAVPRGFPAGSTDVTIIATDTEGNTGSCSFRVNVKDKEAPTVLCPPNINKNQIRLDPLPVNFPVRPVVFDNVDAPNRIKLSFSHSSGSSFLPGQTTVTVQATDTSGNSGSCNFLVRVIACPYGSERESQTGPCICRYALAQMFPTAVVVKCPIGQTCEETVFSETDSGYAQANVTCVEGMRGVSVIFYTAMNAVPSEDDEKTHIFAIRTLLNFLSLMGFIGMIHLNLPLPEGFPSLHDLLPGIPAINRVLSTDCIIEPMLVNAGYAADEAFIILKIMNTLKMVASGVFLTLLGASIVFGASIVENLKRRTLEAQLEDKKALSAETNWDHAGETSQRQHVRLPPLEETGSLSPGPSASLQSAAFQEKEKEGAWELARKHQELQREVENRVRAAGLTEAQKRHLARLESWRRRNKRVFGIWRYDFPIPAQGPQPKGLPALLRLLKSLMEDMISVYIVLFFLMFEGSFEELLGVLRCEPLARGLETRVESAPSVPCADDVYTRWSGIAAGAMVCLGVVIPLSMGIALVTELRRLRLESNRPHRANFRQRFGFLIQGFRPGFEFWELTIIVRKLLLQLCLAFYIGQDANMRLSQAVWLAIFSFIVQCRLRPFNSQDSDILNKLESQALGFWLLSLILFQSVCFRAIKVYEGKGIPNHNNDLPLCVTLRPSLQPAIHLQMLLMESMMALQNLAVLGAILALNGILLVRIVAVIATGYVTDFSALLREVDDASDPSTVLPDTLVRVPFLWAMPILKKAIRPIESVFDFLVSKDTLFLVDTEETFAADVQESRGALTAASVSSSSFLLGRCGKVFEGSRPLSKEELLKILLEVDSVVWNILVKWDTELARDRKKESKSLSKAKTISFRNLAALKRVGLSKRSGTTRRLHFGIRRTPADQGGGSGAGTAEKLKKFQPPEFFDEFLLRWALVCSQRLAEDEELAASAEGVNDLDELLWIVQRLLRPPLSAEANHPFLKDLERALPDEESPAADTAVRDQMLAGPMKDRVHVEYEEESDQDDIDETSPMVSPTRRPPRSPKPASPLPSATDGHDLLGLEAPQEETRILSKRRAAFDIAGDRWDPLTRDEASTWADRPASESSFHLMSPKSFRRTISESRSELSCAKGESCTSEMERGSLSEGSPLSSGAGKRFRSFRLDPSARGGFKMKCATKILKRKMKEAKISSSKGSDPSKSPEEQIGGGPRLSGGSESSPSCTPPPSLALRPSFKRIGHNAGLLFGCVVPQRLQQSGFPLRPSQLQKVGEAFFSFGQNQDLLDTPADLDSVLRALRTFLHMHPVVVLWHYFCFMGAKRRLLDRAGMGLMVRWLRYLQIEVARPASTPPFSGFPGRAPSPPSRLSSKKDNSGSRGSFSGALGSQKSDLRVQEAVGKSQEAVQIDLTSARSQAKERGVRHRNRIIEGVHIPSCGRQPSTPPAGTAWQRPRRTDTQKEVSPTGGHGSETEGEHLLFCDFGFVELPLSDHFGVPHLCGDPEFEVESIHGRAVECWLPLSKQGRRLREVPPGGLARRVLQQAGGGVDDESCRAGGEEEEQRGGQKENEEEVETGGSHDETESETSPLLIQNLPPAFFAGDGRNEGGSPKYRNAVKVGTTDAPLSAPLDPTRELGKFSRSSSSDESDRLEDTGTQERVTQAGGRTSEVPLESVEGTGRASNSSMERNTRTKDDSTRERGGWAEGDTANPTASAMQVHETTVLGLRSDLSDFRPLAQSSPESRPFGQNEDVEERMGKRGERILHTGSEGESDGSDTEGDDSDVSEVTPLKSRPTSPEDHRDWELAVKVVDSMFERKKRREKNKKKK